MAGGVVVVVAASIWVVLVVAVMVVYAVRHWRVTLVRLFGSQRAYYQDLLDSEVPPVSVLIPMHNEERVIAQVLDAILASDYPRSKLEIIPVDDHSEDATLNILESYHQRHPLIKPLVRRNSARGKPAALNDAVLAASHDIVLVFDADYVPPRDTIRQLAMAFSDPEVGAVMGRVVPSNTAGSTLARLLDLERTGGYQVDQQARYDLDLIPQYGGTVGGFRRSAALSWGGFDPAVLAEDTDMTMRLYVRGWRVAYANGVECYEEVPQTWDARFKQLRRWARGHTQTFIKELRPVVRSPYLSTQEKCAAVLLLGIYLVPPLLLSGMAANLWLFLNGAAPVGPSLLLSFAVVLYGAFGNFAPFFQIGAAGVLDGMTHRLRLMPLLFMLFTYNTFAVSAGVFDAAVDTIRNRTPSWDKTARFKD